MSTVDEKAVRAAYMREWTSRNRDKCRQYNRNAYAKHGESIRARHKRNKAERRAFVAETKKDKPCADCGLVFHAVCMDYHHKDSTIKSFNVSSMVSLGKSETEIRDEISKCELVCANCHRVRTYIN